MDLYNQPIVIDNGSGNLKAGFAGEEHPKCYQANMVGRPKYQKIMATTTSSTTATGGDNVDVADGQKLESLFVGQFAQQNRGLLKLLYPVEHGIVTKWDEMETLWYHTYSTQLKALPQEHPLLITECPLNPRQNRDKMCQVLFEQFNVPCLYVLIQAVLLLYASGRTTGVVLDSGDGVSHIVPVYEGFLLPTSIKRVDIAGRDITEQLQHELRRLQGVLLLSSSEKEIARIIKEKCCFVSKDPVRDEKLYSSVYYDKANTDLFSTYRLPDGKELVLGAERFRAPEILFNPQIIGNESPGVHELVNLAIAKTDLDLRSVLYQNIILSGGTTLVKNFGDRLLNELNNSSPGTTKVKIYAPPERKYSTWIGGSILAGLSTFKKMWVTYEEYQEDPNIVHVRCL